MGTRDQRGVSDLGEEGREVAVEIYPDVQPATSVDWDLNWSTRVGVLRVGYCSDQTGEELEQAMENLVGEARELGGLRGVVLDLRGNGGGSFQAAVDVASVLLPKGKVVMRVEERGKRMSVRRTHSARVKCLETPLLILTNRLTASAAEHIVACLQDHGRGLVVGERTYGKSVAQGVYALTDGSGATITIMRITSPHGRDASDSGLVPDKLISPWALQLDWLDPTRGVWGQRHTSLQG
ncbi:unnamed protein product [Discosporangium mesarthrocarpum]